ncbi:pimeloyl-ACP methyl ester carboxylesterase [Alkalibacillus filiformis]|uniref:Pimeloyl-ACP methyl ester carboxylesterase n=1 Tax=Alkalibacillus filiformis TaxID=200990 RepID=A0ABU0DT51_9BACI|nr:alpha/beta hydrolase [Alkalibacillus filiformis]MDQ0351597.1 pimeloyl-ACP methyl ester carboxylesterase [Alkalibacillus filiformis]
MPYVKVNGVKLYYNVKGSGEPILLIHCPLFPSQVMKAQSRNLSESYQVINVDLRGHGRSTSTKEKWDFVTIVEDLRGLLDHLKVGPVWACGYSAGCSIAFDLGLRAPSYVKGLIQVGAVDEVASPILTTLSKGGAMVSSQGITNIIAVFGALSNTKKPYVLFPLIKESFKTNPTDAAAFYDAYLKSGYTGSLSEIDQPTLLVYGERDPLLGRYGFNIATQMPDCQIEVIKGGRHQIPANKSEELNILIHRFISDKIGKV